MLPALLLVLLPVLLAAGCIGPQDRGDAPALKEGSATGPAARTTSASGRPSTAEAGSTRVSAAGPDAKAGAAPVIQPLPRSTETKVVLYFPHRSRPVLVREVRQAVRRGEQPEWFALAELLKGPRLEAARPVRLLAETDPPAAPEEALMAAKVIDGTLLLVLTQPAAETLARTGTLTDLYALVHTAAEFSRVGAVQFQVEGQGRSLTVAGVEVTAKPLKPRPELVLEEGP